MRREMAAPRLGTFQRPAPTGLRQSRYREERGTEPPPTATPTRLPELTSQRLGSSRQRVPSGRSSRVTPSSESRLRTSSARAKFFSLRRRARRSINSPISPSLSAVISGLRGCSRLPEQAQDLTQLLEHGHPALEFGKLGRTDRRRGGRELMSVPVERVHDFK